MINYTKGWYGLAPSKATFYNLLFRALWRRFPPATNKCKWPQCSCYGQGFLFMISSLQKGKNPMRIWKWIKQLEKNGSQDYQVNMSMWINESPCVFITGNIGTSSNCTKILIHICESDFELGGHDESHGVWIMYVLNTVLSSLYNYLKVTE